MKVKYNGPGLNNWYGHTAKKGDVIDIDDTLLHKIKNNTDFEPAEDNVELEDARAKFKALSGKEANKNKKLETILKEIEGLENEQDED